MARVGNALIAYCRYFGKLFYPVKLAAFYPHPGDWPASQVLLAGFLLAGMSVLAVALRRKHPYLLMGWLWYMGTLAPVIGVVQVGSQSIADRYTYIPLIGVCIILAWSANDLTGHWRYQRITLCAAAVAVLLGCAAITRSQIAYWADSETLFRRALAVTRNNALAHLNLGVALGEKGRPEAITEYDEALKLAPNDPDVHLILGAALLGVGRPDEAIGHLQAGLMNEPHHADGHFFLGRALRITGRLDEAILHYREAIRLNPDLAEAHDDLGVLLIRKRQFDEAITQFQEVLRLSSGSGD